MQKLIDTITRNEIPIGTPVEINKDKGRVTGFIGPKTAASTGRVFIRKEGDRLDHEYYPSVINAEIVWATPPLAHEITASVDADPLVKDMTDQQIEVLERSIARMLGLPEEDAKQMLGLCFTSSSDYAALWCGNLYPRTIFGRVQGWTLDTAGRVIMVTETYDGDAKEVTHYIHIGGISEWMTP